MDKIQKPSDSDMGTCFIFKWPETDTETFVLSYWILLKIQVDKMNFYVLNNEFT
jgi:hypothetical protein